MRMKFKKVLRMGFFCCFALAALQAGCAKKETTPNPTPQVQEQIPAELPTLAQNHPFQMNQSATPAPNYAFQESPNDGLEEISDENKKALIPNVD